MALIVGITRPYNPLNYTITMYPDMISCPLEKVLYILMGYGVGLMSIFWEQRDRLLRMNDLGYLSLIFRPKKAIAPE